MTQVNMFPYADQICFQCLSVQRLSFTISVLHGQTADQTSPVRAGMTERKGVGVQMLFQTRKQTRK